MADSSPIDLPLLRGMASFYVRYTPTSNKKKALPDLQDHLSTHLHRAFTEMELGKAYTQCKRRVRDLRDDRRAQSVIRWNYEKLQSSREGRRMTRSEIVAWEESNKAVITAFKSLKKEKLSEVDKVREAVVVAFEGAAQRGEDALKAKKAATEEAKKEKLKKKAEKKESKKAEEEAEKKRKEEEKAAREVEAAAAAERKRDQQANEYLHLKEERDKKRKQREEDDTVNRAVSGRTYRLLGLIENRIRGEPLPPRQDGEGKENKADL